MVQQALAARLMDTAPPDRPRGAWSVSRGVVNHIAMHNKKTLCGRVVTNSWSLGTFADFADCSVCFKRIERP